LSGGTAKGTGHVDVDKADNVNGFRMRIRPAEDFVDNTRVNEDTRVNEVSRAERLDLNFLSALSSALTSVLSRSCSATGLVL
jgi:hypothetical protein